MKIRKEILLTLAALIWGIAFVAQSTGGDAVGSYTFNCVRSIIGSVALMPAIMVFDQLGICHKPESVKDKKNLWIGGISCGVILCLATNLQQIGINSGTAAGKAGFLTACYIIIVPILGIFLKKKCGINVWFGVALTVGGLYLLCIEGPLTIQLNDVLVLMCAFVFAFHILTVDHFSPLVDGVRLSCIQFLVAGIISAIPMILTEMRPFAGGMTMWVSQFNNMGAWISILYAGVMSSGIAYTLQIVGQDGVDPTIASILMSLESVFSVLAGWLILGEKMSAKSYAGCAVIFVAVILAQLPEKMFRFGNNK